MTKRLVVLCLLLALLVGIAPASAQPYFNTIEDILNAIGSFETFLDAVDSADFTDRVNGDDPYTVFAPSDNAFRALPPAQRDALLANRAALADVLNYHMQQGETLLGDLTSMNTIYGAPISIESINGVFVLNGSINVVAPNIRAANGVVHIIDRVLIPSEVMPLLTEQQSSVSTGAAYLRLANFSANAGALDLYVDGDAGSTNSEAMEFGEVTNWLGVGAGAHNLAIVPAGLDQSQALEGPVDFNVPNGDWVTLAVIGSAQSGSIHAHEINEDYRPVRSGMGRLTFFYAVEDSRPINILSNQATTYLQLSYPGMAGNNDGVYATGVREDVYHFEFVYSRSTDVVIAEARDVNVLAAYNYLIVVAGPVNEPEVIVVPTDMRPFAG